MEKELNLLFEILVTKLAFKANVPLRKNEPTRKVAKSISALIVVESEAVLTKNRLKTTKSASSPLEPFVPISQVLEQINLLPQKIDKFAANWPAIES